MSRWRQSPCPPRLDRLMLASETNRPGEVVVMIGIRRDRAATVTRAARRTVPAALIVTAGLGLAACSASARLSGATAGSGGGPAAAPPHTGGAHLVGENHPALCATWPLPPH